MTHARPRLLFGSVRHSAGTVGSQLVGERVVSLEARDFFDQVDLARHVGAPAWDLDRQPGFLRRNEEADGTEELLGLGALDRRPQQPRDAIGAQEDGPLLLGLGPQIEDRLALLAAGHGDDQLDRTAHGVRHAEHVDAALEPIARFARHSERPSRAPNARRLEVGALEHDVLRLGADLRFGTPHDPGDDRGPLGITDRGHVGGERPDDAVQRDDLLARPRPSDDDRRSAEAGEIEGVQRLVQLEEDVVRGVDDVVDGALTD